MRQEVRNTKYKKLACVPWLFLALTVFLLSAVLVFTVIPQSLAAQVTMEVYQQEGRKAFGKETSLDLFNDPNLGGQKLIAPFTNGTYTFAVQNNANSAPLPYSLDLAGINPDGVPLVFSLQKNGAYIFGGEGVDNMLPLSEFHLPERPLGGLKTDLYTVNWAWKTESDAADVAFGKDGTQTYTVVITATGTIDETEAAPKTGDPGKAFMWLVILLVSAALMVVVIFFKRRKDKGDGHQTFTETM